VVLIYERVSGMSLRRWFCACLVLVLSLCIIGQAMAKKKTNDRSPVRGEPVAETSLNSSSVWVVVNLFTGRTSKQAVKVRDTMARLGAEGQGIILPFREVTAENMAKLRPAFLALSPNGMPWCRYKGGTGADLDNFLRSLKVIVEEMKIPVIGICGGHQALALAFGGKVGPIRGGEDDCFPYGKNPTERGRHNVYVVADDPLFQGMGKTVNLVQNHYDEVKKLPPDFVRLAQNELCGYQIIKHPTQPAYGVQAHTEYYMKTRPDGGLLLSNFLRIAKTHNELVRKSIDREKQRTAGRDNEPMVPGNPPR
jgi:GMP synthase (glutamine-hydrolysing)